MSCVVTYERSTDSFIVVSDGKFAGKFMASEPAWTLVPILNWMASQAMTPSEHDAYIRQTSIDLHS